MVINVEAHPVRGHELAHIEEALPQGLFDFKASADTKGRLPKEFILVDLHRSSPFVSILHDFTE
jgi:hypothetical protein